MATDRPDLTTIVDGRQGGAKGASRAALALLALCLAGLFVVSRPVRGQSESLAKRFEAANRAYAKGRHVEAVRRYRHILDDGHGGLGLYHNLGNAYTRLDSTGAAVWAYENALQFAPADRRVRHNLEFVRLREGLPVGGLPSRGIVGLVSGWPIRVLFGLGVLLMAAAGAGGTFRAQDDQHFRWRDPLAWVPLCCGVLLVVVALGASVLQTLDRRAVVTREDVSVRARPDAAARSDTTLRDGAMVEMRSENETWVEVRLGDGTVGWMRRNALREL